MKTVHPPCKIIPQTWNNCDRLWALLHSTVFLHACGGLTLTFQFCSKNILQSNPVKIAREQWTPSTDAVVSYTCIIHAMLILIMIIIIHLVRIFVWIRLCCLTFLYWDETNSEVTVVATKYKFAQYFSIYSVLPYQYHCPYHIDITQYIFYVTHMVYRTSTLFNMYVV